MEKITALRGYFSRNVVRRRCKSFAESLKPRYDLILRLFGNGLSSFIERYLHIVELVIIASPLEVDYKITSIFQFVLCEKLEPIGMSSYFLYYYYSSSFICDSIRSRGVLMQLRKKKCLVQIILFLVHTYILTLF